ncbi:efflux RND transporter permease subunit [Spectribacter hydrogenooxidans]|uniref:MMPL family transporter n=1 Tax=Spectribacter hydrogenoxidans TaxID=3075608 RepID=A0ABU3BXR5_9GAMM|nr:MMPL family transporter [Salinisphaera sp. W335]MDT0633934.1 MMPL family transporter [Salinisphaera sp. W335]
MKNSLFALYERFGLEQPWVMWLLAAVVAAAAAFFAQDFRLDASADSLVLENDEDLAFYQKMTERYGSQDFLIVTYNPADGLFNRPALDRLEALQEELADVGMIAEVTSILNVPLIDSPPVSFSEIQKGIRTLFDEDTDPELAREEFLTSPLYEDLLLSDDAQTTAMLLTLKRDEQYHELRDSRNELRRKREAEGLSEAEANRLTELEAEFDTVSGQQQSEQAAMIAEVREILNPYRDGATIHMGGLPMIAVDMIEFVRSDIQVFGAGVGVLLILLLAVIFRRVRWVLVPAAICATVALSVFGFLGAMGWHVTVVSSNFISLVLILTLSLIVHLVVRQLELHAENPDARHGALISETLRSKFSPSVFTVLTTMVSFASLIVSGIRPVIDFGYMMVCGMAIAFVVVFALYPAALARLSAGTPVFGDRDITAGITGGFARTVARFPGLTWLAYALIVVIAATGISRLGVENRFIDYFKESTEIYQGMVLIDKKLGGTTPLDIIIDAPEGFPIGEEAAQESGDGGMSANSYWFNSFTLEELDPIHNYLDELPETGKVLSLDTTMDMLTQINGGPLDNFALALIYDRLPTEIKETLFDPYLGPNGNQVRLSVRVIDSDENLNRSALLKKIRTDLQDKFGLAAEQIHLTGPLVLYNNVLQSLFRSQILTLGVVFAAIALMLLLLFRSFKVALIGVAPTMVAASAVLGLMGWIGIPLDIMTITIAAITVGIGVHDTIHYAHRFRDEIQQDGDYAAAVQRSHATVGRAVYYTTVTVTLGFSILVLSNFVPTIYFGLLTGAAMVLALIANLTLLPLLLVRFRAFSHLAPQRT